MERFSLKCKDKLVYNRVMYVNVHGTRNTSCKSNFIVYLNSAITRIARYKITLLHYDESSLESRCGQLTQNRPNTISCRLMESSTET